MSVELAFGGDFPYTIEGLALDGFHRPLGGEVANLTVTAAHQAVDADWLAVPPLGAECTVAYDGAEVMTGVLYGVEVTAEAVRLQVEG